MGRRRTNPKYLRMLRQRAGYCSQFAHLAHGNPIGQEKGRIINEYGYDITSRPHEVSQERKDALALREKWQSDFHQNVNPVCFIKVVGQHYPYGLKRSFSGQKHFFVEETFECIKISIVYSNKDIAMMAFNAGRITWIERIPRTSCDPG